MSPGRQQIFELIVSHTREVLPELVRHDFGPEDRLENLGANSVDRAEIVMLVLESLRLRIPRVETIGPRNIGELTDLLDRKLRSA